MVLYVALAINIMGQVTSADVGITSSSGNSDCSNFQCADGLFNDCSFGIQNCISSNDKCSNQKFKDPMNRKCSSFCPRNSYADSGSMSCVTTCPNNYFADAVSGTCTLNCSTGLYKANTLSGGMCVSNCPANNFLSKDTCVSVCPVNTVGHPLFSKCLNKCSAGYFQDMTGNKKECVDTCPKDTYMNLEDATCVTDCPDGYDKDKDQMKCVESITWAVYMKMLYGMYSTQVFMLGGAAFIALTMMLKKRGTSLWIIALGCVFLAPIAFITAIIIAFAKYLDDDNETGDREMYVKDSPYKQAPRNGGGNYNQRGSEHDSNYRNI